MDAWVILGGCAVVLAIAGWRGALGLALIFGLMVLAVKLADKMGGKK